MKLTALDYLRSILTGPVQQIIECPDSCEVGWVCFEEGVAWLRSCGLVQFEEGVVIIEVGVAIIEEGVAIIEEGVAIIEEGVAIIEEGVAIIEEGVAWLFSIIEVGVA